jgi:hypothetical protein
METKIKIEAPFPEKEIKEKEREKMEYETDLNILGLWLYKRGYYKGQTVLFWQWIAWSLLCTVIQLYFTT